MTSFHSIQVNQIAVNYIPAEQMQYSIAPDPSLNGKGRQYQTSPGMVLEVMSWPSSMAGLALVAMSWLSSMAEVASSSHAQAEPMAGVASSSHALAEFHGWTWS